MHDDDSFHARFRVISSMYWVSQALSSGISLGLFEALQSEPQTLETLATRLGVDSHGCQAVLRVLRLVGIVSLEDRGWLLTDLGEYVRACDPALRDDAVIQPDYWEAVGSLPVRLSSPEHIDKRFFGVVEPGAITRFTKTMSGQARRAGQRLASLVDLSNRKSLLDLGGGTGELSVAFCTSNPDLHATVLDRHEVIDFASLNRESAGDLLDRVNFESGDFFVAVPEGPYEALLLSRVLHDWGDDDVRRILQVSTRALTEDAVIIIHEEVIDEDNAVSPEWWPSILDLCLFLLTGRGRTRTVTELDSILSEFGMTRSLTDISTVGLESVLVYRR